MKEVVILYIPVLHKGYFDFFEKYSKKVETLYILGNDLISELMPLHKEIRALDPEQVKGLLEKTGTFKEVNILDKKSIKDLKDFKIISVNESISRKLIKKYFPDSKVEFSEIFLRWDEKSVFSQTSVNYDRISKDKFDQGMIKRAVAKSEDSSCWWRHVGAILVKNKKVLLEINNKHVPSEHTPYINGDPRDFIKAGKNSELSSVLHCEQALIVEAARKGMSLEGTSIYITVFPCPVCAKLIAYSGIKKCFFSSGHASLDGEEVLKANGVELIFVK